MDMDMDMGYPLEAVSIPRKIYLFVHLSEENALRDSFSVYFFPSFVFPFVQELNASGGLFDCTSLHCTAPHHFDFDSLLTITYSSYINIHIHSQPKSTYTDRQVW